MEGDSKYDGAMNADTILAAFNRCGVDNLLIGGMNFLLRHQPVLTYDVDLWIQPSPENRLRCESALSSLDAAWGETEEVWGLVAHRMPGWLGHQSAYCFTSPHGSLDVFLTVAGLEDWRTCLERADSAVTATGVPYRALSDRDMLACQLALPEAERKLDRIRILRQCLKAEEQP